MVSCLRTPSKSAAVANWQSRVTLRSKTMQRVWFDIVLPTLRYMSLHQAWRLPSLLQAIPLDPALLEPFCNFVARIEHTGFHSARWNSNDLGSLGDGLVVVVDEINDFAMGWRQLADAGG